MSCFSCRFPPYFHSYLYSLYISSLFALTGQGHAAVLLCLNVASSKTSGANHPCLASGSHADFFPRAA